VTVFGQACRDAHWQPCSGSKAMANQPSGTLARMDPVASVRCVCCFVERAGFELAETMWLITKLSSESVRWTHGVQTAAVTSVYTYAYVCMFWRCLCMVSAGLFSEGHHPRMAASRPCLLERPQTCFAVILVLENLLACCRFWTLLRTQYIHCSQPVIV
jgi:hypothetical protein